MNFSVATEGTEAAAAAAFGHIIGENVVRRDQARRDALTSGVPRRNAKRT
jgi:hypothetical protein